jgi:hypothetical protein
MKKEDKEIERLILAGGIEVAGLDENGELLYQFTPKMKDISKELYDDHLNFVNSQVMELWELGFLNLDLLADEPRVTLTRKAHIPDAIATLSKQHRWSLEEIKRILKLSEI